MDQTTQLLSAPKRYRRGMFVFELAVLTGLIGTMAVISNGQAVDSNVRPGAAGEP